MSERINFTGTTNTSQYVTLTTNNASTSTGFTLSIREEKPEFSLNQHPELTDEQKQFAISLFQELSDFANVILQRVRSIFSPRTVDLNISVEQDHETGYCSLHIEYTVHDVEYEKVLPIWGEVSIEFAEKFDRLSACYSIAFETEDG